MADSIIRLNAATEAMVARRKHRAPPKVKRETALVLSKAVRRSAPPPRPTPTQMSGGFQVL